MNIVIVIIHNKQDNAKQIDDLKLLVEQKEQVNKTDDGDFITYYYEFSSLPGHQVRFYQVIPYGVEPPKNLYDIDSHKVFYGKEDADKDEQSFIAWAQKRGSDYGDDQVIVVDETFSINKVSEVLNG